MSAPEPFEGAQALVDDLNRLVPRPDVPATLVVLGWAAGFLAAQIGIEGAQAYLAEMSAGLRELAN